MSEQQEINMYYVATNRGFLRAPGEFTANVRLAYPFTDFALAELLIKQEIEKGNCRNFYSILQLPICCSAQQS